MFLARLALASTFHHALFICPLRNQEHQCHRVLHVLALLCPIVNTYICQGHLVYDTLSGIELYILYQQPSNGALLGLSQKGGLITFRIVSWRSACFASSLVDCFICELLLRRLMMLSGVLKLVFGLKVMKLIHTH